MTKPMTKAQYITWLFRMASIEDKHDKFRNGYLRKAMQACLTE